MFSFITSILQVTTLYAEGSKHHLNYSVHGQGGCPRYEQYC